MGGRLFMPGGNPLIMFPGLYINLNLGAEKGDGGTQSSVVNHVGFIVDNVQARAAQSGPNSATEPLRAARPGFGGLLLAIFRRPFGFERVE